MVDVDEDNAELLREALHKLKHAGAELFQIDLGVDFPRPHRAHYLADSFPRDTDGNS